MNRMLESVRRTLFVQYKDIDGRASRQEVWDWVIVSTVAVMAMNFLVLLLGTISEEFYILLLVFGFLMLAAAVPMTTLAIRRLHDTNRSALHLLWAIVPFFGSFYLAYLLLLKKGDEGFNQYGASGGHVVEPSRLDEDFEGKVPSDYVAEEPVKSLEEIMEDLTSRAKAHNRKAGAYMQGEDGKQVLMLNETQLENMSKDELDAFFLDMFSQIKEHQEHGTGKVNEYGEIEFMMPGYESNASGARNSAEAPRKSKTGAEKVPEMGENSDLHIEDRVIFKLLEPEMAGRSKEEKLEAVLSLWEKLKNGIYEDEGADSYERIHYLDSVATQLETMLLRHDIKGRELEEFLRIHGIKPLALEKEEDSVIADLLEDAFSGKTKEEIFEEARQLGHRFRTAVFRDYSDDPEELKKGLFYVAMQLGDAMYKEGLSEEEINAFLSENEFLPPADDETENLEREREFLDKLKKHALSIADEERKIDRERGYKSISYIASHPEEFAFIYKSEDEIIYVDLVDIKVKLEAREQTVLRLKLYTVTDDREKSFIQSIIYVKAPRFEEGGISISFAYDNILNEDGSFRYQSDTIIDVTGTDEFIKAFRKAVFALIPLVYDESKRKILSDAPPKYFDYKELDGECRSLVDWYALNQYGGAPNDRDYRYLAAEQNEHHLVAIDRFTVKEIATPPGKKGASAVILTLDFDSNTISHKKVIYLFDDDTTKPIIRKEVHNALYGGNSQYISAGDVAKPEEIKEPSMDYDMANVIYSIVWKHCYNPKWHDPFVDTMDDDASSINGGVI